MKINHKFKQITPKLIKLLYEYDIICTNWGWHIHKGNIYCGMLKYQGKIGWQGKALGHLPPEVVEQLPKLT
jgi:hypothetical protein